jgi:hypothetical protein
MPHELTREPSTCCDRAQRPVQSAWVQTVPTQQVDRHQRLITHVIGQLIAPDPRFLHCNTGL